MEQELIEEQTQDQTFPTLTLSPFCHPVSCGSTLKPWQDYWLSSGARSQSKHLTIIRTVYNEQNSQKCAWNLEAWKCLSCIASPPGLSLWYVACALTVQRTMLKSTAGHKVAGCYHQVLSSPCFTVEQITPRWQTEIFQLTLALNLNKYK